jgi:hypothetical protein
MSNDDYSQRVKFILVSWCGPSVGILRKAKLWVHLMSIKEVVRSYHIEIPASHVEDLEESTVVLKLKQAAGANYDGQISK